MRALLPLARLARSMVRASSISSTVRRIWRIKALAWLSCLLSCDQLAGVLAVKMALLINILPVADTIHHKAGAFQLTWTWELPNCFYVRVLRNRQVRGHEFEPAILGGGDEETIERIMVNGRQ